MATEIRGNMTKIRHAIRDDLPEIVSIGNHFILNSNALFETEPDKVEDKISWLEKFATTGPCQLLVAEENRKVVGYASCSPYRPGPYFSKTAELSVYVLPSEKGKGVGTQLYNAIFDSIKNEGLHSLVVGIALPNEASIALHRKFGFAEVGVFKEYAMKNGQFISSMWMQRIL